MTQVAKALIDFMAATFGHRVANQASAATERMEEGALYWRELPDGYEVCVYPMTFGKARLCYSEQHSRCIIDAYCYPTPVAAIAAAQVWTGEGDAPVGWHRHPTSGRRREDGDPSKEVVRP